MIYYLNRGLIIEQVIAQELERYIDQIHMDETYPNFHIHVTNNHPFAELYLHTTVAAADIFPSVVVTSETDQKTGELMQVAEEATAIGCDLNDFNELIGEVDKLPGVCTLIDPITEEEIRKAFEKKAVLYGIKIDQFNTDRISIEIWADNNQLKNEVYEQFRTYIKGGMQKVLQELYKGYGLSYFDGTVRGERSNNYNVDFDLILTGAHIGFEINYVTSQIILDTEIAAENIKDIETEVINHVKNERYSGDFNNRRK